VWPDPARGQGRPLSLDQALDLASVSSEQVAIAEAGVRRASGQLDLARADLFPQLSGNASYDRALASEFSGIFTGEQPAPCAPFVARPDASVDARLAELERAVDCGATGAPLDATAFENLPFGRQNTYRVALSFSQNLFSGGRVGAGTALAKAARASADIGLRSAHAQLALDVVQAYYDAALSVRLVEIAQATYQQADATLTQTRLAYEAGSQPEFELLRAQVARDNLRPTVIRSQSQLQIAFLRLKQLLDIPAAETITLTTPLDASGPPAPEHLPIDIDAEAPEVTAGDLRRAPVLDAEAAVRQADAGVSAARAERLPSVSLTSSFYEVAYPVNALPTFNGFRTNWTVGVMAQLPILTGGRLQAGEAVARADRAAAQARLQRTQEVTLVDSRTAYEELRAARASWEASAGTVQQAERAYQIAELRFREGVSTQLELTDAQVLLVQAQATRAQAARDLQVARVRVALLPDLPLGTAPSAPQATPDQQPSSGPALSTTTATPAGSRLPAAGVSRGSATSFTTGGTGARQQ
jgi:outer membrane protein TolC